MDIEWLLSTLFDASLLSPSSRRRRRLFFCPVLGQLWQRRTRVLKLARQLCRKVCEAAVWTERADSAMLHLRVRVTALSG